MHTAIRGGKYGLVAPMRGRGPYYYRCQIPTIATNVFNRSHYGSLNTSTSIVSYIILTYQDFDGAWYTEYYPSLIHIKDILWQNIRILQYLSDYFKPMCDLLIRVFLITIPVYRLDSSCPQFG
jgi:hypothetical protein